MVDQNAIRRAARRAFVEHGAEPDDICATLPVDPETLAGWQEDAAKCGDDWPAARRLFMRAKTSEPEDVDLSYLFRLGCPD